MYSASSTSDGGVFCAEIAYAWAEGGCVSRLRTREITERAYDSFHGVSARPMRGSPKATLYACQISAD